jgi:hypothetical protein
VKLCQLCVGKTKISCDFIKRIKESQKTLESKKTEAISATAEVLRKIGLKSGISLKKLVKVEEVKQEVIVCSEDDNEHLLEEVSNDSDLVWNNGGDDDESSVYVEDSDEDFDPQPSKPKTSTARNTKNEGIVIDTQIKFSCGFCKEAFSNFDILSDHMKTRTCFVEKFECPECKKECKNKRSLNSHKQTHRQKPAKVLCELCAKEFTSQFSLDLHIESIHRRVVKKDCIFRCTTCNEKFESHLDLLDHVKLHAKEKKDAPRLCEFCSKMCPNLRSYNAHVSNHKEKTFICEVCREFWGIEWKEITEVWFQVCKKGFGKKFQLMQHSHVHTGIKAFSCTVCQKSYAKRESLRNHKKREHPEV